MELSANKRYKNFLSTYDFYPNSIDFRIHSSRALEKWKNVQAFQLNQLINGRFYFSADRREILLLKYDLWSRWLYEIENLCIELSGDHLENQTHNNDIEAILNLAEKTNEKYIEIILNEEHHRFDTDFAELWLKQHHLVYDFFKDYIKSYVGLTFDELFTSLVDILCQVMQYTLMEIHELDNMFSCFESDSEDKIPFVVVNNISNYVYKNHNECLICKRLTIYKERFGIKEVFLKNYTDEFLAPKLIKQIEDMGIKINFRISMVQELN